MVKFVDILIRNREGQLGEKLDFQAEFNDLFSV